jgi:phage shock protein PspC (stress-responsive transcriptional regulator)
MNTTIADGGPATVTDQPEARQLRPRSGDDKMLAGVAGGIARYLRADITLVRVTPCVGQHGASVMLTVQYRLGIRVNLNVNEPETMKARNQAFCTRPPPPYHGSSRVRNRQGRTPSYSARQFLALSDGPPGRTDRIRRADSPKAALFTEVSPSSTRFRSGSCSSQLTPHVHGG